MGQATIPTGAVNHARAGKRFVSTQLTTGMAGRTSRIIVRVASSENGRMRGRSGKKHVSLDEEIQAHIPALPEALAPIKAPDGSKKPAMAPRAAPTAATRSDTGKIGVKSQTCVQDALQK